MRNFRRWALGLMLVSLAGVSWGAGSSHRDQAKGYAKVKLGMSVQQAFELMGPPMYGYKPNSYTAMYGWCANTLAGSKSYGMLVAAHGSIFFKEKYEKQRHYCNTQYDIWKESVPKNIKGDAVYQWHPDTEVFNIDNLKLRVNRDKSWQCLNDQKNVSVILEGEIGPDSSFAVKRILDREQSCDTKDTENDFFVLMNSGGGYLEHGYKLGQVLRQYNATTVVLGNDECASSCAIAFLGGKRRALDEAARLLFHSPYYTGRNAKGQKVTACAADDETLNELLLYYQGMLGEEFGDILFDRTMSYCSSTDGWVLTGNSSAELYGITQAQDANIND